MPRHVTDEKSSQNLCFPDTLVFTVSSVEATEEVKRYTILFRFACSEVDLGSVPNSRPIVLDNIFLSIQRPNDQNLLSFRFVKTDVLAGSIVVSFPIAYEDTFLAHLATQPSYFRPVYQADTEEYYRSREVARAEISASQVAAINGSELDLLEGIGTIEKILKTEVQDPDHRIGLLNGLLNEYVEITRSFENGARLWKIKFTRSNPISIPLVRSLPTVTAIVGRSENLVVVVENISSENV